MTGNDFQYEVFAADDGTGSVLVDDDSDSGCIFRMLGPPPVGSLQSMEGWLYHHYEAMKIQLHVLSSYADDFEFGSGPPSITDITGTLCSTLVIMKCLLCVTDNSLFLKHLYTIL